jgi:hypothetical protein
LIDLLIDPLIDSLTDALAGHQIIWLCSLALIAHVQLPKSTAAVRHTHSKQFAGVCDVCVLLCVQQA